MGRAELVYDRWFQHLFRLFWEEYLLGTVQPS